MGSKILAVAAFVALAACTTTGGSFCALQHPIRLSADAVSHLSDAEVAQILATNEKGAKLCRWTP